MGNFGNVMPQAPQGRVLDSGAGYVAQAASNLGQVGMQISAKKLNEQLMHQQDQQTNIEYQLLKHQDKLKQQVLYKELNSKISQL